MMKSVQSFLGLFGSIDYWGFFIHALKFNCVKNNKSNWVIYEVRGVKCGDPFKSRHFFCVFFFGQLKLFARSLVLAYKFTWNTTIFTEILSKKSGRNLLMHFFKSTIPWLPVTSFCNLNLQNSTSTKMMTRFLVHEIKAYVERVKLTKWQMHEQSSKYLMLLSSSRLYDHGPFGPREAVETRPIRCCCCPRENNDPCCRYSRTAFLSNQRKSKDKTSMFQGVTWHPCSCSSSLPLPFPAAAAAAAVAFAAAAGECVTVDAVVRLVESAWHDKSWTNRTSRCQACHESDRRQHENIDSRLSLFVHMC